jgi:hypothetical protein
VDTIKRPNYKHYSRLEQISVKEAEWMIASAQISEEDAKVIRNK